MATADYSRFRRIPEGHCELLSARYSAQSFGRHSHDRYAIGVISAGVEKLYYRGAHQFGTAGSVVTISPGEIHDGVPGSDEGWMYRMLYLDPAWLNEAVFAGRFSSEHIHLFQQALTQDTVFARTFLHHHQVIETSTSSLERETLLLELVAQLFERNGVTLKLSGAIERDAINRIKQKLEDEFDQAVPLEDLAALAGMDPLYLIRVFKKSVGIAPHSYQIQKRIAQVQNLLRSGVSITDASVDCGFFDQSHMARTFKKIVGVTPGAFRGQGRATANYEDCSPPRDETPTLA